MIGERPLEAGAALGLTRKQTYGLMESVTFKEQREAILANLDTAQEEMLTALADRLKDMASRAVDRIEKIVDESINDAVALRAANSILDRIGLKAPERIEARVEPAPPMPEGLMRLPDVLVRRRMHETNATHDVATSGNEEILRLLEKSLDESRGRPT